MGEAVRRADLRKSTFILHVSVICSGPLHEGGEARKIVPIDILVQVLALVGLVEAIERIFERRNTVAQRQPIHIEEHPTAMWRLSPPSHPRDRPAGGEECTERPAERHRDVDQQPRSCTSVCISRAAGQGAESGDRRGGETDCKREAELGQGKPLPKPLPDPFAELAVRDTLARGFRARANRHAQVVCCSLDRHRKPFPQVSLANCGRTA